MRIGIFGGRFDPVHIGHLILAQDVLEHAHLDKILFLLSYSPPHKEVSLSFENRLLLLKTALTPFKKFEVCTIERELALEKSYTVRVLEVLKKRFYKDELFFIMGEDQFINLNTWYKPHKLFELSKVIVLKRHEGEIKTYLSDRVLYVNRRIVEVSSTEIRERIKNGLPITCLVPSEVETLIKEKGFYK